MVCSLALDTSTTYFLFLTFLPHLGLTLLRLTLNPRICLSLCLSDKLTHSVATFVPLDSRSPSCRVVVAHTFNPSTWEVETGGFLSLRPAWSTE